MKFERKPIKPNPSCAMCGKPIKDHTTEEMKICLDARRKANEASRIKEVDYSDETV